MSSRRIYIRMPWYLVYIRIYLYKTNLKYVIIQRLDPIAFVMWKNHKSILASKIIQIQESQGSSELYIRIPKQELRDHEHLLVLRWNHRVWVSEPGRRHALTALTWMLLAKLERAVCTIFFPSASGWAPGRVQLLGETCPRNQQSMQPIRQNPQSIYTVDRRKFRSPTSDNIWTVGTRSTRE